MTSHLIIGKEGEELAKKHLRLQGYKFYKSNVRLRHDEIDLIMYDPTDDLLVFIEVKTRARYGIHPARNITHAKLHKFQRAVCKWVMANNYEGPYRRDIVYIVAGRVLDHRKYVGA